MKEEWKPVKGYEGLYDISNYGRIYVYPRQGTKGGIFDFYDNSEYLMIGLSKNSVREMVSVHILVAKHFIPNPYKLPFVNHRDQNKHNNCVWNLEWCTNAYNLAYSDVNKNKKKTVEQYSKDGKLVNKYSSISDAERETGVSHSSIIKCCNNKLKTAGGFIWKYAE